MTKTELLKDIKWVEETVNATSVGNFKELFSDYSSLLIKQSKNGATRATIMIKKDGKITNITCSEKLTTLVRANKLGMQEIAGFPVFKSDRNGGIFVGLPSDGWVEIATIVIKDYVPAAVTVDEILGASA